MNMQGIFGSALLSAALLTASTGSAATLDLQFQSSVSAFLDAEDKNPFYVMSDYTVGGTTIDNSAIGAYRLKAELYGAASDFIAFCLEPLKNFNFPDPGLYKPINKFGEDVTTRLNMLAENAMSLVQSHETAAAFQMAAWEITTEIMTPSSVFDLDDGFFEVAGGNEKADRAKVIAEGWLDNIENDTWAAPTSSFLILNSVAETDQDLITSVEISAIPLPATGLMMATALLGAGGLSARRRRAARQT